MHEAYAGRYASINQSINHYRCNGHLQTYIYWWKESLNIDDDESPISTITLNSLNQKNPRYMTLKSQVLALDRHENVAGLNWLMEAFLDINFSIILTYITFIRIMVFLYFFKKSSYKLFLQHVNSLIFSLQQNNSIF